MAVLVMATGEIRKNGPSQKAACVLAFCFVYFQTDFSLLIFYCLFWGKNYGKCFRKKEA